MKKLLVLILLTGCAPSGSLVKERVYIGTCDSAAICQVMYDDGTWGKEYLPFQR